VSNCEKKEVTWPWQEVQWGARSWGVFRWGTVGCPNNTENKLDVRRWGTGGSVVPFLREGGDQLARGGAHSVWGKCRMLMDSMNRKRESGDL